MFLQLVYCLAASAAFPYVSSRGFSCTSFLIANARAIAKRDDFNSSFIIIIIIVAELMIIYVFCISFYVYKIEKYEIIM